MKARLIQKPALAFLVLICTCLCGLVFLFAYQQARESAISRLHDEQMIHAKQAAQGIQDYCSTWTGILSSMARMKEIAAADASGRQQMEFFYDAHKEQIRAFTRVDENGVVLVSIPQREAAGRNISSQKHIQELLRSRKPVVSDVFRAVQGYDAIALHVPVYDPASLTAYQDRLVLAVLILLAGGVAVSAFVVRAMVNVKEEEAHREAEAELRASEQRYRDLFEHNPAPMLIYERGTLEMVAVNEAFLIAYGYTLEEVLALHLTDLYPEEEKEKITQVTAGLSGHTYVGEWHHRRKDGTVFPIVVTSHDLAYKGRTCRIAVITDITERKKMEKAIEEESQFNRILLEQSPDGIVIIEPATARFFNFNGAACRQLGYDREEFSQLSIFDVEAQETHEETRGRIADILANGSGSFETVQRTRSGELRNVEVHAQIVHIQDHPVYYCIWRDVTEHKKLEEQLRQSQKMESVGRLAGGVAHDFNNMLGVIIGSAELCRHQLPEDTPVEKYLEHILKAAQRSSEITRQLLAFSRKEIVSPKTVNLNSQVIDAQKMLCRLIGEDIRLSFKPATSIWTVLIDPSQVDQILMNLSANSRDAMPDGGTLNIETANVRLDQDYCRHHSGCSPGDYVKLTVSDTGIGMDRETREHIFEPFFTTKGLGVGTGLGLATVYGIVSQNNGFITVYSEPGHGTVFTIYFPRLPDVEADAEEVDVAIPSTGSGTVLLVEDEKMLLWTTTRMLEEMGYTVIQAQSPAQAIEICGKGEGIDLVLTDVVMPGMNGREMTDRIRAFRPEVKVLFMSGYTADIVAQRGIVEEGMHYIPKPLDARKLNEKIAQMLAN